MPEAGNSRTWPEMPLASSLTGDFDRGRGEPGEDGTGELERGDLANEQVPSPLDGTDTDEQRDHALVRIEAHDATELGVEVSGGDALRPCGRDGLGEGNRRVERRMNVGWGHDLASWW